MVVLIIAALYAYVYFSATRALGTLEVVTLPPGAKVFINENYEGVTPLEVGSIPLGFVDIHIEKEGYDPYSRVYHFQPNEIISLNLHLSHEDFLLEEISFFQGSLPRGLLAKREESLYLLSTSGEFLSYDLPSSSILWEQDLDAIILSLPGVGGGRVYGATFYGAVHLFLEETGEYLETWETGKAIRKMLISDTTTISLLHNDGSLSLWEEGELLVSYEEKKGEDLFLYEDLLLLTKESLLFFHPRTGSIEEELPLPTYEKSLGVIGDSLYLWGEGGLLFEVDLLDREHFLRLETGILDEITSLSVDEGILYLGTEEGEILAFYEGELLWEKSLGEGINLLDAHQFLLVGTQQRSLYLLEREGGSYLARKALPSQITGLYLEGDYYYLALRDGTLARLIPGQFHAF